MYIGIQELHRLRLMPSLGTEYLAWSERKQWDCIGVSSIQMYCVTPPILYADTNIPILWILQDEEYKYCADSQTGIQCSREDVVVLRPPSEMPPTDDKLEDEPDNGPGDVIDGGRGWDETRSREDEGEVDVADDAVGPFEADDVCDDGADEANDEEYAQCKISLPTGELASGANDAPDDGGRAKHLSAGAAEVVLLVGGAHVVDVGEHPCLDTELNCSGNNGCDNLGPEHGPRGDFHVVAKFEVRRELDALGRGDIAVCDEHHIGNGTAREHGATNQLADQIYATVLICDCHDDADGYEKEAADAESKKQAIPW